MPMHGKAGNHDTRIASALPFLSLSLQLLGSLCLGVLDGTQSFLGLVLRTLDVVEVEDLRVHHAGVFEREPAGGTEERREENEGKQSDAVLIRFSERAAAATTHTRHVSTGRSASLKLQSKAWSATGSSVGSWYGARYSWLRASAAVIRFFGSNTSIFSKRSSASGSAFLNLWLKGTRSRFGRD